MQHKETSGGIAALATKGRNGDNTLVHMTHEEVAALQRFAKHHGKSLTINPETGLPEAFSLKGLLPMLGGAAGMMFGIPPWVTAAALGGLQTAATGDLSKGLVAGLGAYGGGNLAAGFGAGTMGAAEAGSAAASTPTPVAESIVSSGTATPAPWTMGATEGVQGASVAPGTMPNPDVAGMGADPTTFITQTPPPAQLTYTPEPAAAAADAPMSRMDLAASNWDKTTSGIQNLGTEQGRDAYLTQMGGGKATAQAGLQALAPALMWSDKGPLLGGPEYKGYRREYTLDRGQNAGGERAGGRGERMYFNDRWTEGPVTALADGGGIAALAGGGTLGNYSDGGQALRGPGDGVSDSIPAIINGKQPAKLTDGEFVVPARTVSELGNGSTEAGTRQLYAMLDRIQHARKKSIGKGKVAVDSKAAQLLPA